MADVLVPRGASRTLGRVEGDLRVEDATVKADSSDNTVHVKGSTLCVGDCSFNCSLRTTLLEIRDGELVVEGDLEVERITRARTGALLVKGSLCGERLDVDRRVEVSGDLDSASLDVGGSLIVGGKARVSRLDVGGSVRVDSKAAIGQADVGGRLSIGGGVIQRFIDVGGVFESSQPVEFAEIRAGGMAQMAGGKGGDIKVGGSLTSEGDLDFDEVEVDGEVEINGNATGRSMDVGGTVFVSNNLKLSGSLDVGGTVEVGGTVMADSIKVGGKIEAEQIEAVREIETRMIITRAGAKAEHIEIGRRDEAEGPIIAEKVLIKERAHVEDVYGRRVELRKDCRVRSIYAATLSIESGCVVTGEVKYIESLKAEPDVTFVYEPERVRELPRAPV